jgi:hypothetical protein
MMNSRYSYFINDSILINENISNNEKYKEIFYQIYTGGKIVNRNNISLRLISRILSKYRDINLKISLVFFNLQMVGDIEDNKNENDGDNNYKKVFRQCDNRPLLFRSSPAKRSAPISIKLIKIRFVVNTRLISFVRIKIQN